MAVVAVLAGAVATFVIQERRAERERREVLLKRYLAQLQDACESLWYRLKNRAFEHADVATDPDYLVTTTMYTLGRALGIERMLALEGLYPEIWKRFPRLQSELKRRVLDEAVRKTTKHAKSLQHYDRVALAEAVVERDGESFWQSTFLEFRGRVESQGPERKWWEPARESVDALKNHEDAVRPLMTELKKLVAALEPVTKMEAPELEIESESGGRSDVRHEVRTPARSTRQATRHDKGRGSTSDPDAALKRGHHGEPRG